MINGDIGTSEKIEYEDLLKNYYEKMEIIEEQDKEIERLTKIEQEHQRINEELRGKINKYDLLIFKIERYLNCYQYFLETQEENNKKIANMIHEFETKDSDK